jgi:hypothetical protein
MVINNVVIKIKKILSELTGKKNVFLVRRGNISIRDSLRIAKTRGYKKVLIQDQGGWITYAPFAKKLKLELDYIATNYGLIKGNFYECILLINTMPAYAFYQDVKDINALDCIIINDVSGSIGTELSKWGDIIFGSFGKDKPIDLGRGGFIATDFEVDVDELIFTKDEIDELYIKLTNLEKRIIFLKKKSKKIKKDLKKYNLVLPENEGINVLIKTSNDIEKNEIMDYCDKNKLEYTSCPRYIRMNQQGLSIEVKRL